MFRRKTYALLIAVVACFLFSATPSMADTVPQFNYTAPGWFAPLNIPMGQFWSKFGYQETGTNYYSAGAPESASSSVWSRFDPQSDLYQAWSGNYVINDFQAASEWSTPPTSPSQIPNSVQRLLQLSAADQIVWLSAYGDPAPLAQPGTPWVRYAGHGWFLLEVEMDSHSDVGDHAPPFGWYPSWTTVSSQVAPYAPVTLHIRLVFTYDVTARELYVRYASGTSWTTLDGACHGTPIEVVAQQIAMMAATKF